MYGNENEDYSRLAVNVYPCNFGYDPGVVPSDNPTCVIDKEKQIEFLDPMNLVVMYNSEFLNVEKFGYESPVLKESIVYNQQIDPYKPNWFMTKLRTDVIEDETQFVKLGAHGEHDFNTYELERP